MNKKKRQDRTRPPCPHCGAASVVLLAFPSPETYAMVRARAVTIAKREAELHYAIRHEANILDTKLTEEEAHNLALRIVTKMRLVWETAHEVDKAFSRDAPMVLVDPDVVAEQKLEKMRLALDAPVSGMTARRMT